MTGNNPTGPPPGLAVLPAPPQDTGAGPAGDPGLTARLTERFGRR